MTSTRDSTTSDRDLLGAWGKDHDETSFQILCQRHAGLVLSACRRLQSPEGDEATQAVFVILARKPQSVADPERLAGWLLGTARRVVGHQQRAARRRQRHEQKAAMEGVRIWTADSAESPDWSEARLVLDEALSRLSPARREAVARFYLQQKPLAVVAAELGCSVDAVKNRIHVGLEQLRSAFAKRGVALSVTVLTSGLASEATAIDPAFALTCSQAAVSPAGPAATLAHGAQTAMFIKTVTLAACACVLVGSLVTASLMYGADSSPAPVAVVPVPVADITFTPRSWMAPEVFDDIHRRGGPRVALLGRGLDNEYYNSLLVPMSLRSQPIASRAIIAAVAASRALSVAWVRGGTVAVLYPGGAQGIAPGVAEAEIERLRLDLASTDASRRIQAAWRAGWLADPRVVPQLVTAAGDAEPGVAQQALASLRRLSWKSALALDERSAALVERDCAAPVPATRVAALSALAFILQNAVGNVVCP